MKALAAALATMWAGAAEAACRLALVLALDVSGSVDEREYALQLAGVAEALDDRAVRNALLALPDAHVRLAVFEWSSAAYQRQILGWTPLGSDADIDAVVARLRDWRRGAAPEATGLGAAMRQGALLLQGASVCWKRVIDISGDGKNNDWPQPHEVKAAGTLAGITVNALVIGVGARRIGDERQEEIAELSQYFRSRILHGQDAFLEVALGFEDYARAMTRKLLREVSAPPLGLGPAGMPATRLARGGTVARAAAVPPQ